MKDYSFIKTIQLIDQYCLLQISLFSMFLFQYSLIFEVYIFLILTLDHVYVSFCHEQIAIDDIYHMFEEVFIQIIDSNDSSFYNYFYQQIIKVQKYTMLLTSTNFPIDYCILIYREYSQIAHLFSIHLIIYYRIRVVIYSFIML